MNPDQLSHSNASNAAISTAFPMTITVAEPLKEFDGTKDAFISYLITTKTTLDTFSSPTVSVRRRFQDFVWLHNSLSRDFAACVVPPLPDRHRMEYITGDRFGPEFVEKRRASLQRFLTRLSRHPTLQRSEYFRIFLESREW
ncbi:8088_t:CDS:2, partial [Gigaspora rosea]